MAKGTEWIEKLQTQLSELQVSIKESELREQLQKEAKAAAEARTAQFIEELTRQHAKQFHFPKVTLGS